MNAQTIVRVGVGVIIEDAAGRVLLIQRATPHGNGTWSNPGGHLDPGETPDQCAIRETREETGIEIGNVRFRGLTNDIFAETGKHYITIWMQGDLISGEPTITAPREVSEIGWFAWDALPEPLFLPLAQLVAGRVYR
ncbi:MAG: NUDIX domain-containing protein [Anaerolineae bacterium]|nr:NUDIX domain-containing protein [Anaerolineae bacterium]